MLRASDIMSRPVTTVSPATSLTEVARTLIDNGYSGCPIVDGGGTLRGIVSRANLLDYALSVEGGALTPILKYLVPGGSSVDEEEVYAPLTDREYEVPHVEEVMSSDVISVQPETPIAEIASLMSAERIHRVPVVGGGQVVGIITSLDLLGVYSKAEGATT